MKNDTPFWTTGKEHSANIKHALKINGADFAVFIQRIKPSGQATMQTETALCKPCFRTCALFCAEIMAGTRKRGVGVCPFAAFSGCVYGRDAMQFSGRALTARKRVPRGDADIVLDQSVKIMPLGGRFDTGVFHDLDGAVDGVEKNADVLDRDGAHRGFLAVQL